ncbi:MAG: Ca-activated chloride channel [Acidobacteriota bacterium]|nr:Ca-activated chloride channel [Acidobacteriota bacterium]
MRLKPHLNKKWFSAFLLPFTFLLLPSSSVRAQDELPPPPPPPSAIARQKDDEVETIRVNTELVDLNVSVFSRDPSRPTGELQQQDFAVLENGAPEEISFFASASTPFDLVLLIDLSGSTADKLGLIRKSANRFVEAARPLDRISVVTFTDLPVVVSPLTADRKQLRERIKKIEKPQGGTNFWDALRFVLTNVFSTRDASRRQAVIVMSDGVDNALPDVPGNGSGISYEQLLEMVRSSEAVVIPIYLDTEREMVKQKRATGNAYTLARQQLTELAGESGSLLYRARKVEDLHGVYEQVIRDLGMIYNIGYQPKNKRRDGSWRSVSVRLVNRPDLSARSKRGYYAK